MDVTATLINYSLLYFFNAEVTEVCVVTADQWFARLQVHLLALT